MFLAMKLIGISLEQAPLWWWEGGIKQNFGTPPGWRTAPRELAPDLFKLAWRKNQCVKDDLITIGQGDYGG
jgi:hypothetical protein